MSRARGLVMVSAGLGLAGGGAAAAGRLMAACAQAYCEANDVRLVLYHLGTADAAAQGLPAVHFGGGRAALAVAVLRLQVQHPDHVVFFDHPGPARIQALLPRAARARYGVFAHGIEVWKPLSWDRDRALRQANLVLTNSQFTRREALAAGNALERAEVLPLALETRRAEGGLDEALLEQVGVGFLLIVGRMSASERYKGHDALIEAVALLRSRFPGLRLVVVGDGDDRRRLEALARERGVPEAVRFTGFVSEVTRAALYERCLAFVMPSAGEGFGLVYLEAMRAGKPCVALAGTAAAEIVDHDQTGLLVDASATSLESALRHLLEDPALVGRLGSAGRRRFTERFSTERFARAFAAHLERLREVA